MSSKKPLVQEEGASIVKVGILHSLTGTMAISEPSLVDAELMAIEEINQAGGVLNRIIQPVIVDGASDSKVFAAQALNLIQQEQVATIFGCWTSASRKAVLSVLEKFNKLLWYPLQYEGLECSPYIVYNGSCPNQQIEPAVNWLLNNQGNKFYLIGSDYVFPRTIHKVIQAQLKRESGQLIAEKFVPLGSKNFREVIKEIRQAQPDVVFSTLNGDSNLAFYQQYREAGINAQDIPIMAVSIAEEELRRIGGELTAGHYAAWSYFQSIDTPENQSFVRNYQRRYGQDRVTSDPIEAAYAQVYLWKLAVDKAQSFSTDRVRGAFSGIGFDAPGGWISIEDNQHLAKPCRVGKIQSTGQFEIIYDSELIKPRPWLGVEDIDNPRQAVIIDLMAEVSPSIEYSCQLEESSRTREKLMAELIDSNQQLRTTQKQLLASEAQSQKLRKREELLKRRLSSQIRNSLELDQILTIAVEEVRNLLHIDCCEFLFLDKRLPSKSYLACATSLSTTFAQRDNIRLFEIVEELLAKKNLLKLEDISQTGNPTLGKLGLKSLLAIPVGVYGHEKTTQRKGIIICQEYRQYKNWAEQDIELLEIVVEQLAIAIEQATLYENSLQATAHAQAQAQQLEKAIKELKETQAQLIQTEKMSTLGQLVAGIAHEINNPVSFICGNLDYAKEYVEKLLQLIELQQKYQRESHQEINDYVEEIELEFLREDLPKTLNSMELGAERIRKLVLSLRNFSRRNQSHMQEVNLHDGLDSTLVILSNRIKSQGPRPKIEIIKEYGDIPLVKCYPSEINQVFMNILGNAIDALEESWQKGEVAFSGSLTIKIYTELRESNAVIIKIFDNGSGISPHTQNHLFDPFFTTKPIGKGTGLGLSISRSIVVDKHGGKLECRSTPGQGTEFRIELRVVPKLTGVKEPSQSSVIA